ncbi:MAG: hypothetical protein ACI840_002404 [Ulvibacter sp.]|jgi:hypothetical protein
MRLDKLNYSPKSHQDNVEIPTSRFRFYVLYLVTNYNNPLRSTGTYVLFYSRIRNKLRFDLDEHLAGAQASTFSGKVEVWPLVYSKVAGNKYYDTNCQV